jgi:hypothetical protein
VGRGDPGAAVAGCGTRWWVLARSNVSCGWVGRRQRRAVARVHFVDFAMFPRATSTFFPDSQHFVDLAKIRMSKSTKCCLTAAGSPASLPSRR